MNKKKTYRCVEKIFSSLVLTQPFKNENFFWCINFLRIKKKGKKRDIKNFGH